MCGGGSACRAAAFPCRMMERRAADAGGTSSASPRELPSKRFLLMFVMIYRDLPNWAPASAGKQKGEAAAWKVTLESHEGRILQG
ncbi:hypothetical protein GCM10022268_08170 [Sphingomonas cynarae]|uniref:Uncharacterized protein n=1 Tax=Sphingomonas cynarae TaxID=930197 RepID=A0ABP7D3T5_9SPHN